MPPAPDTPPPPEPAPIADGVPPPEPTLVTDGVRLPGPTPIAEGMPPLPPVAAVVLPHPPLLVPALAGTAAAELDPLRTACHQALSVVLAAADSIVVVGPGPVWGMAAPGAVGSFRPYGADARVTLPALADLDLPARPQPDRLDDLPLSLAVAAFLLAGLDPPPTRTHAATVPASFAPEAAAAVGRALMAALPGPGSTGGAGREGRVGLVVMADLSACRTERAPGAFRPEAAGFDAAVAEALRSGRPGRLLALEPAEAAELLVAGLAPLQVLAGAYGAHPAPPGLAGAGGSGTTARRAREGGSRAAEQGRDDGGSGASGRVLYEGAPYGVGYLVAVLGGP